MLHLHETKARKHLAVEVDRLLRLPWNMTKVET